MRVLYLPGMSGDGGFWAPVAERLPRSFEGIFLDWPGLGSVPASPEVRSFEDLIRLSRPFLDEPTVVVGQSMGGAVALRLALDASARVTHLVLCATSGGLDMGALGAVDWRPGYRELWPDAPDWAFEPIGDVSGELAGLDTPSLLLWASDDPVSPVAVGEHLLALLPQATLKIVHSADHTFARTLAGEVAPLIESHLAVG